MAAADAHQEQPPKKKRRPKRNQAQIPQWWMELTPHNTLDVEDEKTRQMYEERMALWYAEQAEEDAAKGMMFDIDGNPLTEEEASQASALGGWRNRWNGRQNKDGQGDDDGEEEGPRSFMFGGRNFKPGSEGWDPRQWGIDADDEEFDLYQTGAKLPPEYVTAMTNYAKAVGKYKDPGSDYGAGLRSTEGLYGRLGEKPAHQPDWMKKKLRSTKEGQTIRHGIYNDSPNKHLKYRTNPHIKRDDDDADKNYDYQAPAEDEEDAAAPEPEQEEEEDEEPASAEPDEPVAKPFSHKDYYYNSTTPEAGTVATNGARRQPEEPPVEQPNPAHLPDPDEDEEVVEEEEEVVEEEEMVYEEEDLMIEVEEGEESVYEEVVEEEETVVMEEETVAEEEQEAPAGQSLEDLQATLAAKMAELKRLQGGA
uniref:Uncharacterized protein n=1 Tax=Entomoneis paludosa TaxID=265537 RepID=A0A7S2VA72_9STRA|mmetsp:Transcript_13197/g.27379  ORF Transcript_13197/g.27379 Transcript_13197/m.27379 type:complete len:422 (+) Transcript_13197:91-1356(+)